VSFLLDFNSSTYRWSNKANSTYWPRFTTGSLGISTDIC